MRKLRSAFTLLCLGVLVSGCISPRSYVDQSFQGASYEEINRRREPMRATVVVEFQRNGETYSGAQPLLRDISERVLRGTGVILPTPGGPDGVVRIVVNNFGDLAAAAARGFGTGLTFGAVGTTVTDNYEMTITITAGGVTRSKSGIRHALHTAIGNTSLPSGVEPVTPDMAFQRVVEAMLLRAVRDMQRDGDLDALATQRMPEVRPTS